MKIIYAVLLVIGLTGFCDCKHLFDDDEDDVEDEHGAESNIINGVPVDIETAPYQVQLQTSKKDTVCGGAIIHERWILTAAHCFDFPRRYLPFSVLVGSQRRNDGDRHVVKKITSHQKFDRRSLVNDIALMELIEPIELNDNNKKAIELLEEDVKENDTVIISGFGQTTMERESKSWVLEGALVPAVSKSTCKKAYKGQTNEGVKIKIGEGMFCAGDGQADTCQGDSGGPAVVRDKLAGVVSFGINCSAPDFPGVYTKVSHYIPWINEQTGLAFGRSQNSISSRKSNLMDDDYLDLTFDEIDDPTSPDDYKDPLQEDESLAYDFYDAIKPEDEDELFSSEKTDKDDDADDYKEDEGAGDGPEAQVFGHDDKHTPDGIVHGEVVSIRKAPYQVQLQGDGFTTCGGSIINKRWVLTAAHCLHKTNYKRVDVLVGSMRRDGGIPHRVKKIIIHKKYNPQTYENDIALIELKHPVVYSERVKKVKIGREVPRKNQRLTLSGYGQIGTNKRLSDKLRMATTPVVGHKKCESHYATKKMSITNRMFCAGNGQTDTCQGDSGGPALIGSELYGVVSFGFDCADKFFPGVYTLVSKYIPWIKRATGLKF